MITAMCWLAAAVVAVLIWGRFRFTATASMVVVVLMLSYLHTAPPIELTMPTAQAFAAEPSYVAVATSAYHRPGCPMLTRLVTFDSDKEARNANRQPCPHCFSRVAKSGIHP